MKMDIFYGFINSYFENIGINPTELAPYIQEQNFRKGCYTKLPNVSILKDNRITSSNQTHIHITTKQMFTFYDEITGIRDDEKITILLINGNFNHLKHIENARRTFLINNPDLNTVPSFKSNSPLNLIETHTVKKIALRSNGEFQVQISKHNFDGRIFKKLREGLFKNDILFFLQYAEDNMKYLAIVIPYTYHINTTVKLKPADMIEGFNTTLTLNSLIDPLKIDNKNTQFTLRKVSSKEIANYTKNDSSHNQMTLFDLSVGNKLRAERTERHQIIVKALATLLEKQDFELYEGNIDCLALKSPNNAIIFEVKTLDGSPSDEAGQVKKALSQLLYYEFLVVKKYPNFNTEKFALFESKISDEHFDLLESYNCFVLWIEDNKIQGSTKGVNYFA